MNIKRHIFNFIADHHTRLNYLPTQAETRQHFANLTENVDLHLEQLQREGLLELDRNGIGSISMPHTFPLARRIGLTNPLGFGASDADDSAARSIIGLDLRGAGIAFDGDFVAQIVEDDSMIDAGIDAGDVAILKTSSPERGEIVAVMEAGRSVLRRYVIIADIPHFLAENPARPDLTAAHDKPIHGTLWCLIVPRPNQRSRSAQPIKKINYIRDGGLSLGSEFVPVPKSESKKKLNLNVAQGVGTRSAKLQDTGSRKTTRPGRNPAGGSPGWPAPPSGTALNDKGKPEYRGKRQSPFPDERPERPYGHAFTEALAEYAAQAKQERITQELDPAILETAELPQNLHRITPKVVRRDPAGRTPRKKAKSRQRAK